MGYYVQTARPKGKVEQILQMRYDAVEVDLEVAEEAMRKGMGVIIVVDNGPFEAAGFAYNEREFEEFTDRRDLRPKRYVVMPRDVAEKMSGYREW